MVEGGCYCGAVRYAIRGDVINSAICHCRDCQKSSGSASVAWLVLKDDAFSLTKGTLKLREGKNGAQRLFCGECGTGIIYKNADLMPKLVDVQTVTLDSPEKFAPEINIQLADQISWHKETYLLPGCERFPPHD